MKLTRIVIKKLFDQFDYDIPLANPSDLLILTAPNGFGKTMILNIIDSFFNKKFYFFQKLVFTEIAFHFDKEKTIEVIKKNKETRIEVHLNKEKIAILSPEEKYQELIAREMGDYFPNYRRVRDNQWMDLSNGMRLSTDEMLTLYGEYLPEKIIKKINQLQPASSNIDGLIDHFKVYLIKEQRIFKRVAHAQKSLFERENGIMGYTIQEYAQELQEYINRTIQISFKTSQDLDSSFPKRLLNEKKIISEAEFAARFAAVHQKQAQLREFGITESLQEIPTYDEANAKVLLIYLNDIEQKLNVFASLLQQLELFTNILNERRFTFKNIQISKDKGFSFITHKGKDLQLTDLSSGEQHEVVLLYELIFKTTPNTLVLIDEPEISLHVTWQKEFLNDLLAIMALRKMQLIVATHSPQIVNDRWDLVFNLETQELQ